MNLFFKQTNLLRIASALLLMSFLSLAAFAQHSGKPVLKDKLVNAIKTKALTEQEMITGINQFGVNFELTKEVETELRNAGASDAIIDAVKNNYLGADSRRAIMPTAPVLNQANESVSAVSAATSPNSKADDLIGDGVVDFAAGEYKSAIKKFEQAAKIDPTNANAYFNLGEVYYETKNYQKSIEAFQKTLSLDPHRENAQKELDDAVSANQSKIAADKEKQARRKAKWAAFGQAIDQIATQAQQNNAQSNGQSAGSSGSSSSGDAATRANSGTFSGSSLPAGNYACFTTVSVYAGRGGSGAYTYPIYNSTRQTRGSIRIQSGGTYLLDDGTPLHYSFSGGAIRWLDGTFAEASSSNIQTDNQGNPQILIKFNSDKDVWDCTKQ